MMIDMEDFVIGQELLMRNGEQCIYVDKTDHKDYPYVVSYIRDGKVEITGSRTRNGRFYKHDTKEMSNLDVIGDIKMEIVNLNECSDGDELVMRNGRPCFYKNMTEDKNLHRIQYTNNQYTIRTTDGRNVCTNKPERDIVSVKKKKEEIAPVVVVKSEQEIFNRGDLVSPLNNKGKLLSTEPFYYLCEGSNGVHVIEKYGVSPILCPYITHFKKEEPKKNFYFKSPLDTIKTLLDNGYTIESFRMVTKGKENVDWFSYIHYGKIHGNTRIDKINPLLIEERA